METRPRIGNFQKPFGCAEFVIEFLKGNVSVGSKRIDPNSGAPMTDIHFEYKSALHRAHARDAVEREEEKRIKRGKSAATKDDYCERLKYFLGRIPYKLYKLRYASFTRYFGHLKHLGWVEETEMTEPSAIQDSYPSAPSRVYYRVTSKGRRASSKEIADPIMTLYHYSRRQRSAKRYSYYRA